MPEFLEMQQNAQLQVLFPAAATASILEVDFPEYHLQGYPEFLQFGNEIVRIRGLGDPPIRDLRNSPASVTANVMPTDITLTVQDSSVLYGHSATGLEMTVVLKSNDNVTTHETLYVTDILSATSVAVRRPTPNVATLAAPLRLEGAINSAHNQRLQVQRGAAGTTPEPIGQHQIGRRLVAAEELVARRFLEQEQTSVSVSAYAAGAFQATLVRGYVNVAGLRRPAEFEFAYASTIVVPAAVGLRNTLNLPVAGTELYGTLECYLTVSRVADTAGTVQGIKTEVWDASGTTTPDTGVARYTTRPADNTSYSYDATNHQVNLLGGGTYLLEGFLYRAPE